VLTDGPFFDATSRTSGGARSHDTAPSFARTSSSLISRSSKREPPAPMHLLIAGAPTILP